MSLYDIFSEVCLKGGAIVLVLMTLIQITPLKINPWTHIAKSIGKIINGDLQDDIKKLSERVDNIDKSQKEMKESIESVKEDVKVLDAKVDTMKEELRADLSESCAVAARTRILIFGDEVSHGQSHSREHFKQILRDITDYNNYCMNHPLFANDMTKITAERIKEDYNERDKNNTFL